MINSILGIIIKDLKITKRNPSLMFLSVVVPVVFVFLYSLITQMSTTNNIVVAQTSIGAGSNNFIEILENMSSVDGNYFNILTYDTEEAFLMYQKGKVGALIEIPEEFDTLLSSDQTANINSYVNNINSDGTKNFQLRLAHAIYLFQNKYSSQISIIEDYSFFDKDIPMKLYVAIGLLMFAVIYSSMTNTGILITREWEERTGKEIILSPQGFLPFVLGKWITTLLQTIISMVFIFIIMHFILGLSLKIITPAFLGFLFILFLFGASIGSLIGIVLQKSLPVVTISATLSIFFYFICANESSLRGLANSGGLLYLWKISTFIPVTQITENMRQVAYFENIYNNYSAVFWMCMFSLILTGTAIVWLKKRIRIEQGQ